MPTEPFEIPEDALEENEKGQAAPQLAVASGRSDDLFIITASARVGPLVSK
jgi:hypothetical protein